LATPAFWICRPLEVTVDEAASVIQEPGSERAEAMLASFGISKPNIGWNEDTLSVAITRCGWSYTCDGEPGNWRVTIAVRDDESGRCEALSGGPDRLTALLTGFALALQDSTSTNTSQGSGRS
jgi:hypothetical protein